MKHHVVYLTGAPATGKSTLGKYLANVFGSELLLFEYGHELTKYLNSKKAKGNTQEDLRRLSAQIVEPEDISYIDEHLIKLVAENRDSKHIVIDSHAVTKEKYGFRVAPFSTEQICQLNPTLLFVLYTDASIMISRISNDSMGRPIITEFEGDTHTYLQSMVAINYGMTLGIPIYYIDAVKSDFYDEIVKKLQS